MPVCLSRIECYINSRSHCPIIIIIIITTAAAAVTIVILNGVTALCNNCLYSWALLLHVVYAALLVSLRGRCYSCYLEMQLLRVRSYRRKAPTHPRCLN